MKKMIKKDRMRAIRRKNERLSSDIMRSESNDYAEQPMFQLLRYLFI